MLLNNEWVNNDTKEEIKKVLETNEDEHAPAQNGWILQRQSFPLRTI